MLQACEALKNAESFRKFLHFVLLMGNFNNGLGHNGGAHGFKISSLNRLADTKAANGLTWLHYVVKYVSLGLPTPDIQLFVDEIEKAAESYRRRFSLCDPSPSSRS